MARSRRGSVPGLAVAALAVLVAGALAAQAQTDPGPPATVAPLPPDVVESVPHHLQIQNQQQRELLRFSTTHINVGNGPLQIRGGGQVTDCEIDDDTYSQCTEATQEVLDAAGTVVHRQPAGLAVFHPEHNHWHQEAVARFAVLPGGPGDPVPDTWPGGAIAEGTKVTFCLTT